MTRADVNRRFRGDRGQAIRELSWYEALDKALDDPAVVIVVVQSVRQGGKTTAAIRRMVGDLLTRAGSYSMLISAGTEQAESVHARKLRRPVERLLRAAGLSASTIHMTKRGAENPAIDAVVEIVAANEATAPSRSVTLLVIDEAKNVADAVFAALAPSIIAAGGKILLLSTPGAPRGFYHALATGSDPEVRVIRCDTNENPYADAKVIGFLRRLLERVLPVAARRDLGNQFAEAGDRAIPAAVWTACVEPAWSPLWATTEPGLVLGIDAATKGDTCAAVGVFRDGEQVILGLHKIWRPTREEPLDLREVEEWVLDVHRHYRLVACVADPYQMARSISALRSVGVPITEFLQTPANLTKMTGVLLEVLTSRAFVAYPCEELAAQAANAIVADTTRGYKLDKARTSAKIDAVVALAMAITTAVEMPVWSHEGSMLTFLGR